MICFKRHSHTSLYHAEEKHKKKKLPIDETDWGNHTGYSYLPLKLLHFCQRVNLYFCVTMIVLFFDKITNCIPVYLISLLNVTVHK